MSATRQSHAESPPETTFATTAYLVGKHPLKVGDGKRLPGQIMDVAGWSPRIIDTHLNLGWIEEVKLLTDADRKAFDAQWQLEEAARTEARAKAAKEAPPKVAAPPRRPTQYLCATCQRPHNWVEPPADTDWFRCTSTPAALVLG